MHDHLKCQFKSASTLRAEASRVELCLKPKSAPAVGNIMCCWFVGAATANENWARRGWTDNGFGLKWLRKEFSRRVTHSLWKFFCHHYHERLRFSVLNSFGHTVCPGDREQPRVVSGFSRATACVSLSSLVRDRTDPTHLRRTVKNTIHI